jgi:hypothetical protein
VCVIILQMEANDGGMPGTQYAPMELFPALQIIENVTLNNGAQGTKKPARKVARRVRDVLRMYSAAGLVKNLIADEPFLIPLKVTDVENCVGYQENFKCLEDTTELQQKVATPVISPNSGAAPQSVTISCATAGATIWYTLDGSHPWEENAEAEEYTGTPIEISEASVLRVRAFKDEYFGSNTAIAVFS